MKRKVLVALMTMLMMVGLVGCGNDASANQSSTTPETQPTESAVVESIPEESSEETKETEKPSDETGEDDETMENAAILEDEGISGLIIATFSLHAPSESCEITSFDPVSGATKSISNFYFQNDFEITYSFTRPDRLFGINYCFDEFYTKMAATKNLMTKGEVHAGWLLSDGGFFDVTEAVGMARQSDFADPVVQYPLGFTDDGRFVFYGVDSQWVTTYYSVPLSNVSPDTVVEGYMALYSLCGVESNDCVEFGDFSSDWIDATHCILTSTNVRPKTSFIFDVEARTKTEYIPGNSRINWNGRLSPDGTQIAFTSAPVTEAELPDIYITSIDGGEPTKVVSHDFELTHIENDFGLYQTYIEHSCILIDWR